MKYCSFCRKREAPWYSPKCDYCRGLPFDVREIKEYTENYRKIHPEDAIYDDVEPDKLSLSEIETQKWEHSFIVLVVVAFIVAFLVGVSGANR